MFMRKRVKHRAYAKFYNKREHALKYAPAVCMSMVYMHCCEVLCSRQMRIRVNPNSFLTFRFRRMDIFFGKKFLELLRRISESASLRKRRAKKEFGFTQDTRIVAEVRFLNMSGKCQTRFFQGHGTTGCDRCLGRINER